MKQVVRGAMLVLICGRLGSLVASCDATPITIAEPRTPVDSPAPSPDASSDASPSSPSFGEAAASPIDAAVDAPDDSPLVHDPDEDAAAARDADDERG